MWYNDIYLMEQTIKHKIENQKTIKFILNTFL